MNLLFPRPSPSQTIVTPSVSVQERYDSNVVFGTFASGQGGSLWDLVTTVSPKVAIDHQGVLVKANMYAALTSEFFANNPGLNYVGFNTGGALVLDRVVGRLFRGATLQVADNFVFTPQLPTFLAPTGAPDSSISQEEAVPTPVQADIARGVQAARANSVSNYATAASTYPILPSTRLLASYTHSYVSFGNPVTGTDVRGSLLSSTTHTATGGLQFRPSPSDIAGVTYNYSVSDFTEQSISFTTHGISVNYTRIFMPGLTGSVTGTYLRVEPPFESTEYVGAANLSWTSRSQQDMVSLRYSRAVVNSIVTVAVPLVSDNIGIGWTHRVTTRVSFSVNANYANNRPSGGVVNQNVAGLAFKSYEGTAGLNYMISRNYAVYASYSYGRYEQDLMDTRFAFSRHTAMVGLTAMWPQKVNN